MCAGNVDPLPVEETLPLEPRAGEVRAHELEDGYKRCSRHRLALELHSLHRGRIDIEDKLGRPDLLSGSRRRRRTK